jgi:hypothetical protein
MSALKIEAIDFILAPASGTLGLELGARVAKPNLLPQRGVNLRLLVALWYHSCRKLHLSISIAGWLKARPGHPLDLVNILNKAWGFVREPHFPHRSLRKACIYVL